MTFYDIMLLYRRYEAFVNEENEQQMERQKKYEEDYQNKMPDYSNIGRQMSDATKNIGSFNTGSITSGFQMPNI